MMFIKGLLFLISVSNPQQNACKKLIVNDSLYTYGTSVPITSARLNGECIEITVSAGYCHQAVELLHNNVVMESEPPRMTLKLVRNGKNCSTTSDVLRFDISDIKKKYPRIYVSIVGYSHNFLIE